MRNHASFLPSRVLALVVVVAGASVLANVGCTSILGDFDVGSGASPTSDAGNTPASDAATSDGAAACTTQCSGTCVDLTSDGKNCGECGKACNGGQSCKVSTCACPQDEAFCGGQCAKADRTRCGGTCTPCQADEVCNAGCVPAALPRFVHVPPEVAGWQGPDGAPLEIEVENTGVPGTIYECRTGLASTFNPTVPAWGPCDGQTGSGTKHRPTPIVASPEGSYRTEYRYRSDTFRSATIGTRYYAHHKLDKVATCPRPGNNADGPHAGDAAYFAAAQVFSQANPTLFPTSATFPASSNPPSRDDDVYLFAPFIKIQFRNVIRSAAMNGSGFLPDGWPAATGGDYLLNERTLRHRYAMNPGRTMVLTRREYIHPDRNDCSDVYDIGSRVAAFIGPTDANRGRRQVKCEAFVLNTRGIGLCLGPEREGAPPSPRPIDTQPANPQAIGTTLNVIAGSTTATSAFSVSGFQGHYLLVPDDSNGIWYRVTNVVGTSTLTFDRAYQGSNGTGVKVRFANDLGPVFNVTTGYAKLHDDPASYAAGIRSPFTPQHRTKCETVGCTAGSPWLTYLPP